MAITTRIWNIQAGSRRITASDCDANRDCARCGWTYKKKDLLDQNGLLVCDTCFDSEGGHDAADTLLPSVWLDDGNYGMGAYGTGRYGF